MEVWGKNWPDAFALYIKYLKQSRIQETNQTRTLNAFLREWLWRWDKRIKNARDILKKLWLIDDIVIRDQLGKVKWHYVRVNYLINEDKVRTSGITCSLSTTYSEPCVDESTPWWMNTNALSNININALSTQYKNMSTANGETTDISKEEKEKGCGKEKKKKRKIEYPQEFEELWRTYPQNWWKKEDMYKAWIEYSEEEHESFLFWAKLLYLYREYIRYWEVRMSQRIDRWMEWYVKPEDRKSDFIKAIWQLNWIQNEEIKQKWLNKAKELFGEDYVRGALIKASWKISLDLH